MNPELFKNYGHLITLLLEIIRLIIIVAFCTLSVVSLIRALVLRKKRSQLIAYSASAIFCTIATIFIWKIDIAGKETTNREYAAGAFEDNFGFRPPDSVKEIKVKNYNMRDAFAHWMAFTYDSAAVTKILRRDSPLDSAYFGSNAYQEIRLSLHEGCANCPGRLKLPDSNTSKIFFKKGFLKHSASEYYLWVNSKEKMVFLEVSYFD